MNRKETRVIHRMQGFSLVELMVGLTIGLIATLIISQAMGVFESQKRSTTGTADAQTNGGIALYTITRELKVAGYPLAPSGDAGATDSAWECTSLTLNTATSGVASLDPVTITNGTSDTITIRYGSSQNGGVPSRVSSVLNGADATIGNYASVGVQNAWGCNGDDVVVITNGGACDVRKVVPPTAVSGSAVTPILENNTGNYVRLNSQPAASIANANLACLGPWNEVTYSVDADNNLVRTTADGAEPVVSNVVNIQAQYGISDAASSNAITQWVEPTGSWAAPSLADRNRIKAVRVAIIARNAQIDDNTVSTACDQATFTGVCAWQDVAAGGAITVDSPAPVVNLSGGANWNRYRYRVFETIIPLRNMVWARSTL